MATEVFEVAERESMPPVEDLITPCWEAARKEGVDSFVRKFEGIYLLGEVPATVRSTALSFHTGVRDSREMEAVLDPEATPDEPGMKVGSFLVKVVKTDRNPWLSWVSVGRARNNDVVIRHASVSKLHAQIHTRPGDGGEVAYGVVDANSSNGTLVNGRRQRPPDPTPVRFGDEVKFGDIRCVFLDARALHQKLRSMPEPLSPSPADFDF